MKLIAKIEKPYTEEEKCDFIVEYNHQQNYEIKETENALEAWGYTEEEETTQRQEKFENQFILTSLGNYRLQPKGYANAQQSVDTINGMVEALGSLTEQIAEMVIFYPTPDFTKEEECTEEWLIAHQYNAEPMTQQQWIDFYIEFTTLYAQKQYKAELMLNT